MSSDKLKGLNEFLAEMTREGPLISATADSLPPTLPDQTTSDEPVLNSAVIETPPDEGNAATIAEHAKSVLAGLNRDVAIRLRWALRDIKARRTKLSPIDPNDLAALIDLDFVEMRDGTPTLTRTGNLAID